MSIRTTLPLLPLCMLAACGSSPGGAAPDENTALVTEAIQSQGDQGDDHRHMLLISVDGMHQSDLDWYVANHPNSTFAKLTHSGSEYTKASTSNPSDSDPGGPR